MNDSPDVKFIITITAVTLIVTIIIVIAIIITIIITTTIAITIIITHAKVRLSSATFRQANYLAGDF